LCGYLFNDTVRRIGVACHETVSYSDITEAISRQKKRRDKMNYYASQAKNNEWFVFSKKLNGPATEYRGTKHTAMAMANVMNRDEKRHSSGG
jgi:hypothetical protein